MRHNLKLTLAYDGANYHGWQRQPDVPTIQDELERALGSLAKRERLPVFGAGRTDAGVHARGQVASVLTDLSIPEDRWPKALNTRLPRDIRVRRAQLMPPYFHARYDALGKRYVYLVERHRHHALFNGRFALDCAHALDIARMCAAAQRLIGEHDFAAFTTHAARQEGTVRTISAIRIFERGSRLALCFCGQGFLWNQVRTMAGTLLEVGRGAVEAAQVGDILRSRDRRLAGPNLPAHALYLCRVFYPSDAGSRPHRSFAREDLSAMPVDPGDA